MLGYDPAKLGEKVERFISRTRGEIVERRYYRFRAGKWYGGIASADVVGCNLRCKFCWSWNKGSFQTTAGFWVSPIRAAERLREIARSRGYGWARLTGGEPLLAPAHLEQLLEKMRGSGLGFILETNGILVGLSKELAERLAYYGFVVVRVSIKGASPQEFYELTGASPDYFRVQLRAIENLVDAGMEPGRRVYPAVMLSFSSPDNVKRLVAELREIDPRLVDSLDPEYVILYPQVKRLLSRYGLKPRVAYEPSRIPRFMV